MAIGASPTIPLYRVQPTPDSRLQRFGVNNSQLFGKPLVSIASPETRPVEPAKAVAHVDSRAPEASSAMADQARSGSDSSIKAASTTSTYSGRSMGGSGTMAAAKPGTYVDTKA